jgi:hypothetical protein
VEDERDSDESRAGRRLGAVVRTGQGVWAREAEAEEEEESQRPGM